MLVKLVAYLLKRSETRKLENSIKGHCITFTQLLENYSGITAQTFLLEIDKEEKFSKLDGKFKIANTCAISTLLFQLATSVVPTEFR